MLSIPCAFCHGLCSHVGPPQSQHGHSRGHGLLQPRLPGTEPSAVSGNSGPHRLHLLAAWLPLALSAVHSGQPGPPAQAAQGPP